MKASYKDSMQNVVFGESEKAKIRRVILAATVPVKQRSNILHSSGGCKPSMLLHSSIFARLAVQFVQFFWNG